MHERGTFEAMIRNFPIAKGGVVNVYQGTMPNKSPLDIYIKYQLPGQPEYAPNHVDWAIDLLIKRSHDKALTARFCDFLLSMWSSVRPFQTAEEQQICALSFGRPEKITPFNGLNVYAEYSVEMVTIILELLMIQEKTNRRDSFIMGKVLEQIRDDKSIHQIANSLTHIRGK